jgi:hypothetical protein
MSPKKRKAVNRLTAARIEEGEGHKHEDQKDKIEKRKDVRKRLFPHKQQNAEGGNKQKAPFYVATSGSPMTRLTRMATMEKKAENDQYRFLNR